MFWQQTECAGRHNGVVGKMLIQLDVVCDAATIDMRGTENNGTFSFF